MTNESVARAFSGHRFEEALESLAPDVSWILVGEGRLDGRVAVAKACRATAQTNAEVTTSWLRFVSTGDGDVVAVDVVGRYEGPEGVSTVSSCDIYEFTDGVVHTITSYAVEIDGSAATDD